MSNVQFSEVQLLNLSALFAIRDSVQHDRIAACCKFGLSADQAHFIGTLSIDQILVVVLNVGQECLFLPRQDIVSLLALPAPLAGVMTSVHPPHKATTPLVPSR
jgi:hypothetical protein